MLRLFIEIFTSLASLSSVLGLYLVAFPVPSKQAWWHWVLIGILVTSVVIIAIWQIVDFFRLRPKTYKKQAAINRYMCRWVSSGGRVVIFSRDMSWAGEGDVREVLLKKAKQDELTICLEKEIALTTDLKKAGAKIIPYGQFGHAPRSRFTIVDFGKDGARVAVGVHDNGRHVIQVFRSGTHPFFAVAEDLVQFLMKAC